MDEDKKENKTKKTKLMGIGHNFGEKIMLSLLYTHFYKAFRCGLDSTKN